MQKFIDLLVDPYAVNIWGTNNQLTREHVQQCLRDGWVESAPLGPEMDHRSTWLHAARVAYFVENNDYEPIDVDVHFTGEGDPYLWVTDGNHRLAAALYIGSKHINVRT